MANETATPTPAAAGPMTAITVRASGEFVRWAADVAANQRVSVAALIELALIDYARRLDWDEDPPHRLARRSAADSD